MPALQIMITDAGIEAIADAQGGATEAVVIAEIGLTNTPFVMAPTIEVLPGEFRRIATVAGQAVAENILHVTAYDAAAIAYDVTGFGLYDADGTLIAVYSDEEDPILSKAALATSLFAIDISIAADIAAVIEFGDPQFLNPPATETVAGVAEIADNDEADAGLDDATIMSPKKVKRVLDALAGVVTAALNALTGRTITGGGVATGGGDLSANRVITVTGASGPETLAGGVADKVLTPAGLAALGHDLTAANGSAFLTVGATPVIVKWVRQNVAGNSSPAINFAAPFPNACFGVVGGAGANTVSAEENFCTVASGSWTVNGFTAVNAFADPADSFFIALGN